MALSTYAEVISSVTDWLKRTSVASQAVDFIALAESELNTELRMRLMEVDQTVTLTIAERTIALPAGYLEPISLEIVRAGEQNSVILFRQPQQLGIDASAGASCRPQEWTVNGSNIEFPNLSDDTYTMKFRMLKALDLATDLTNACLTKYPGLYLYGALLQASLYLIKDDRIPVWQSRYDRLFSKAEKAEARSKALTKLLSDHPSARGRTRRNIYADQ